MEGVSQILADFQQSLLPEVEAHWLEHERTSEQKFQVGDQVRLRQGRFYHQRVTSDVGEVGYCNGGRCRVLCGRGDRGDWYPEDALERITPEQPKQKRVQVGWIEERWGNKNRKRQSLSLYYCCYLSEYELHGEGDRRRCKKERTNLQSHQCQEISAMVQAKRPYTEILDRIRKTKHYRTQDSDARRFFIASDSTTHG
jgi:hypothetical protein